jgi:hypothetical protein
MYYLIKQSKFFIIIAFISFLFVSCVSKRGVDFGYWARSGESINTIHVFTPDTNRNMAVCKRVLILPPIGDMPAANLDKLQNNLQKEMQNYFAEPVFTLDKNGDLREYLRKGNITAASDQFNYTEIGKIGEIAAVSHVMAVRVRDFRPYPPQILSVHLVLIESESDNVIAEINANFDASQQVVVLSADDYLQRRLARNYDSQSLDMLLSSPSEYSLFVSAECCRALAEKLKYNKVLKKQERYSDKQNGTNTE